LGELTSAHRETINAVAGPSTAVSKRSGSPQVEDIKKPELNIIDIGGKPFKLYVRKALKLLILDSDPPTPPPTQPHTTFGAVGNRNMSFSGSFHVDESLKSLDPWGENVPNHVWDF